jgi:hypothetical protein
MCVLENTILIQILEARMASLSIERDKWVFLLSPDALLIRDGKSDKNMTIIPSEKLYKEMR